MILTIVTISIEYPSREFDKTIASVLEQSNTKVNFCAVISRVSEQSLIRLHSLLKDQFASFNVIANQDSSLYNAMNLALDSWPKSPVLFLNAGDVFFAKNTVDLIYDKYQSGCINAFSVANSFGASSNYCRFSNPKYYKKSLAFKVRNLFSFYGPLRNRLPPHQGIVAVYQDQNSKPLRFADDIDYSADSYLIQFLMRQDIVFHDDIITLFEFGGVSSRPSLTRLKSYFRRTFYLKVLLEPILIFVCNLSPKFYFVLINRVAGNSLVGE